MLFWQTLGIKKLESFQLQRQKLNSFLNKQGMHSTRDAEEISSIVLLNSSDWFSVGSAPRHCCILQPVCMADPHFHGNSCRSLGWASMSQQKWGLFVQISFLAVHEKSTGGNTDAMQALQKQRCPVILLPASTMAGQWWDTAENNWTSENTGSGTARGHNYCIAYKGWAQNCKSTHTVWCNPIPP